MPSRVVAPVLVACGPGRALLSPGTLTELDRESSRHNVSLLANHFPGSNRPKNLEMMVIGDRGTSFSSSSRCHRSNGRYAYLRAANRDAYHLERSHQVGLLRVIDLLDPLNPKEVAGWWVPGQRRDEKGTRSKWRSRGDLLAFENFDGPMYVPNKVENGGR